MAQWRSGNTTIYPEKLYPGENVVTITNERGIDKIRYRATPNTVVTIPSIPSCAGEVHIRVRVDDPTSNESVDLTLYDCDGSFVSHTLQSENWTIRKEYTGKVKVGGDTCLSCEINTTERKLVDSIVVDDPRFTVRMPRGSRPWTAEGDDFHYLICYRPTGAETVNEKIRLYVRRGQPNGGLTEYMIEKPIVGIGVIPPPPPTPKISSRDTLPPLVDPTTFRNIIMPTAESVGKGGYFLGNYDLVGMLAGYGLTDRLTILAGGAGVPASIAQLLVATAGVKYEAVREDGFNAAAGFQYGYSSTKESDISLLAPYAVLSLGDRARRVSLAAGYAWKKHSTPEGTYNRNAYILALGGDITVARAWKIAAETYVVESSGLAPVAVTARWFAEHYALDAGLAVNLNGFGGVRGTGSLSGEADKLPIAPILSFIWRW
jgi:hypothetical protein